MIVSALVAFAHEHNVVHQLRRLVMRHAGRGLVEQQQFRLADQRTTNLDAAAIDHRQAGDRFEHAVGKRRLEHFDQRSRGAVALLEFALERTAPDQIEPKPLIEALVIADHDVIEDRQRQRQAGALEGAGNSCPIDRARRNGRDVGPVEHHTPRISGVDPCDDVEECGLAGTIGADEADDFAGLNGEIEPVQRQHAAEALHQAAGFQQRGHGCHPGK